MIICGVILFIILSIFIIINGFNKEHFYNQKLDVAVIVEPRPHPKLIPVIQNFIQNLPSTTKIQVFYGNQNKQLLLDAFSKEISSGKMILTPLHLDNLTLKQYNKLCTSKKFYKDIQGENILIFQTDTCLCNNSPYKIDDFLKYDYIGAPWKDPKLKNKIGNGGLSLRKRSKMMDYIDKNPYKGGNEDLYFSRNKDFYFPSEEVASQFSTEAILNPKSYGVHKPWINLSKKNLKKMIQSCPEIKEIFYDELKKKYK